MEKSKMNSELEFTPEQLEAIKEIDRNLQIIACAGSGKTEVITQRIAYILQNRPDVKPENIVAFTFTRKAAENMRRRIQKAVGTEYDLEGMFIGTIHAFCYELLIHYVEQYQKMRILDTVKSHLFIKRYYKNCGMEELQLDLNRHNIQLFLTCIEKLIDSSDHIKDFEPYLFEVLQKYSCFLKEKGYFDFSTLLYETVLQISKNEEIQRHLGTIKYLVVDEYQDVDDLQEKLIQSISDFGANICVVGDDDQTIYQFRGSNAKHMISFAQNYSKVRQIKLEHNFRSNSKVIDIANIVIERNKERLPKRMSTDKDDDCGIMMAAEFMSPEEEYRWISEQIVKLHETGVPYKEIAILFRKRKNIRDFISVLENKGIPYQADSAELFFKGNYFNVFLKTFELSQNLDKALLFNCWKDHIEQQQFRNGYRYLRQFINSSHKEITDLFIGFCEQISFLDNSVQDIELRQEAYDRILCMINDYEEIYGDYQFSIRLSNFIQFLEKQASYEYRYQELESNLGIKDQVAVTTVHKSKGLEYHSVFIPDVENTVFPSSKKGGKQYYHVLEGSFLDNKEQYESTLEDERKLFYVAVTRAKTNLFLTYELSKYKVSQFIKESMESEYLQVGSKISNGENLI